MKTATPLRAGLALAALLAGLCLWAAQAQAYEGINRFDMVPNGTQAGGHPDVIVEMEWDNSIFHEGEQVSPNNPCACDDARVITQHFPTGFIGNPHATPTCEIAEFTVGRCPETSQVGVAEPFGPRVGGEGLITPLYNVTPHPEEASLTAFWVPLVQAPVFISLYGRTDSDYGLDAESSPIYHPLPLPSLGVRLWGVPADASHTEERFRPPLQQFGACFEFPCEFGGAESNIPPVPYLEAPTECNVPLEAIVDLEYYTRTTLTASTPWPETTGCQQLTFNPSLTAVPTTGQADSASGVDIDLQVPQEQSPTTPSPSEIKAVTTVLPEGFSINPNAADGKVGCSDADTAIGTLNGSTCPAFSKVGSLELDSSALPTPIPGWIYLGEPKPGDRYRLILSADGFGTHFKLVGSVHPNETTGQMTVSFENLPQSPLTEFKLHFFGSERGLLATPTHCGSYPVESEFVPWDNELPTQRSKSSFEVTSGPDGAPCPSTPRPLSPVVKAGSSNTTAGRHSPFSFELSRADGEQTLSTVTAKTPPGFAATLAGIPYCPDTALAETANASYSGTAELISSKCPVASQIGTAVGGAGAGTHPVYLPGKVFLAGPYRGAPLSIAVITPAVSGPYDLGNIVVRAAVNVNPVTAQVTVSSDPLPRILGGVPLRIRFFRIDLNREDFALNPTNCDPFSVETTVGGDEGSVVSVPPVGYQVANCAGLPYGPKLSLKLSGGVKRRGHPAIHAVLKTAADEANSKRISVALPKGELLDNAHIGTICTRPQFAAGSCPAASKLGTATAVTPLLDAPLTGSVYLRSSSHALPDLVLDLRGQINVEVAGSIDTVNGGSLRTTFATIPDAPITQFTLDLAGGSKGLLVNSQSLCGTPKKASVSMAGQNGAVLETKTPMKTSCGSKARHKRHHKRHHKRRHAARKSVH
jgi:hypothetical protein